MRGIDSPRAALFAASILILAGCMAPTNENEPPAEGHVARAPEWTAGDWWTYRWESEIYGYAYETTVVAGEQTADARFVGMPVDDYSLDALLFHLPAVGALTHGLAYEVHEVLFEPIRFPLQDGTAWEAHYITAPVHFVAHAMNVSTPDGAVAGFRITNEADAEPAGRYYHAEYAPDVGWFTLFERVDLDGRLRERITLLAHGSGFEGTIRLIDDIRVLYLDARTTTVLGVDGAPAAPLDAFEVPADLDRVFAACLFGDGPGAYDVVVESPTGVACENRGDVAPDDLTRRIVAAEVPAETGTWSVRMAAAGTGLAIAEVLGYRAWEITLPAAGPTEQSAA